MQDCALVPLSGGENALPFWVGAQPASIAEAPRTTTYSTGPDYLKAMGMTLLQGRYFTTEDTLQTEKVVVINDLLAHQFFPNNDAVGKTITFIHVGAYRVIGVVAHVHHFDLGDSRF